MTEPCAYRVVVDFKDMASRKSNRWPSSAQGRQFCWNSPWPCRHLYRRCHPCRHPRSVAAHPEFKIVGSVTGDWDQTTAQKAGRDILPSLPDVVGIVDQGGDGYGAAQAFAAAGKPRPTIIMGNRQDELQWWKERRTRTATRPVGFDRARVSSLAFWVAQQVLDGRKDIPHDLLVPYLAFTQDDFEAELPKNVQGRRRQPRIHAGRRDRGHQSQHQVSVAVALPSVSPSGYR